MCTKSNLMGRAFPQHIHTQRELVFGFVQSCLGFGTNIVIPNNVKRLLRHPQLTGVALWGIGHLLANGESRSIILFGGLGAWAIAAPDSPRALASTVATRKLRLRRWGDFFMVFLRG